MIIVHLCGTAYLDGWGYQDNLLPEYQCKLGHEVHVIAPGNHFPSFLKQSEVEAILRKGTNYSINGVEIHRLSTYFSTSNQSFVYHKLYRLISRIKPDIIYNHGVYAPMLLKAALYTRLHKDVKLVVDNHADYINCSKNKLWFNVYIKGFERTMAMMCAPVIIKAYGVTNMRCDYLHEVYGFKRDKIKLLPIGADTDAVKAVRENKNQLREKYGLTANDFVIVSGGKMGKGKGTDNLIKAFKDLRKTHTDLKLVLFGKFEEQEIEELAKSEEGISLHGWCDRQKTLELLKMANVACWPLHHTTLIEDAVACATPLVLRKTGNTEHLIKENGEFVAQGSTVELVEALSKILCNTNQYNQGALTLQKVYSYSNIAIEVINDCCIKD